MNSSLLNEMRDLAERAKKPGAFFRVKHRGLPVGTVRTWGKDGLKYQKQRDGSWAYYTEPGQKAAPAKEPEKPAAKAPEGEKPKTKKGALKAAAGKAWHAVTGPFKAAFKLATDKKYRAEFKKTMGDAIKKETKETKQLLATLKKAVTPGQKVTKEERNAAINQVADLAKVALLGTFAGHMAAEGAVKFLATLASPLDEMAGIMLDGPLRRVTKKIFGKEHGLLPDSFYSGDDEKKDKHEWVDRLDRLDEIFGLGKKKAPEKAPEQALLEKIVDALFDELAKEGFSDEDIENALQKSGMTPAQAKALADQMQKVAKKGRK